MKDDFTLDLNKSFRSLGEEMVQVVKETNESATEISPFVLHNILRIFYEFLNRFFKTQGLNPAKSLEAEFEKLERRISEDQAVLNRTKEQLKTSRDPKTKKLLKNKINNVQEELFYLQRVKAIIDEGGMKEEIDLFLKDLLYKVYGGETLSMDGFKEICKNMVTIFSKVTGSRADIADIQESQIDLSRIKDKNWFERLIMRIREIFHPHHQARIKATGLPDENFGKKGEPEDVLPEPAVNPAPDMDMPGAVDEEGTAGPPGEQPIDDMPEVAGQSEPETPESEVLAIQKGKKGKEMKKESAHGKKGKAKLKKSVKGIKQKALSEKSVKKSAPKKKALGKSVTDAKRKDLAPKSTKGSAKKSKTDLLDKSGKISEIPLPGNLEVLPAVSVTKEVKPQVAPSLKEGPSVSKDKAAPKIDVSLPVKERPQVPSPPESGNRGFFGLLRSRIVGLKAEKEAEDLKRFTDAEESRLRELKSKLDNLKHEKEHQLEEEKETTDALHILDEEIDGLVQQNKDRIHDLMEKKEVVTKLDDNQRMLSKKDLDEHLLAVVTAFISKKRAEGYSDQSIGEALARKKWPSEYIQYGLET